MLSAVAQEQEANSHSSTSPGNVKPGPDLGAACLMHHSDDNRVIFSLTGPRNQVTLHVNL